MSVPSFVSCGVQSLSLPHLSRCSFITSCSTHWIASQVLHTARCPGWHRLSGRTTVGSETHSRIRFECISVQALNLTVEVGIGFPLRLLTCLLRRFCRPSLSVSSVTDKALGRSCLLAKISKTASLSSSSCSQRVQKTGKNISSMIMVGHKKKHESVFFFIYLLYTIWINSEIIVRVYR